MNQPTPQTPRTLYGLNYRAARYYANLPVEKATLRGYECPDFLSALKGDIDNHRQFLPKDANFKVRRRRGVVVVVDFQVEEYRPGVFRAAAFLADGLGGGWQIGGFLGYGLSSKATAWDLCRIEAKKYAFVNVVTHITFKGL